jgi:hypothetical protein
VATYKLIQDIEAEDHILGPLTLRQFIFALVAVFCFYLSFLCLSKLHAPFLLIIFMPPGLFCAFFAFPFGRDQPTEIWALAKLRFLFKPRQRIWDQTGIKELVTVTAPKKIEPVLTNGLSQTEVASRLKALANTIDSRGWAVKNINLNAYAQPNPIVMADSDRLIDISNIPQEVPTYDVRAADDILDETSNPIAQQFDHMITESAQTHRQQIINEMNNIRDDQKPTTDPVANYWYVGQPGAAGNTGQPPAAPPIDEAALTAQLKAHNTGQGSYSHLRTLQPLDSKQPVAQPAQSMVQVPANPVTGTPAMSIPVPATPPVPISGKPPTDTAILSLAHNNDLNVATLAREAGKSADDQSQSGEVVISLH